MGFLTYKAVGSTGRLSDGEEGYLPVLPRRILVTESLPLPIRGPETKKFEFAKLIESGQSDTLRHQSLTVQMVSNPSWYAVMALPYLMEFPHQCTEQTFNRLYANSLARHIAMSDPKIRRVFDQWKGTPALDSPLEKNQDLKAVMLEETPWLRQAQAESQARRNVGILFDDNRLNDETSRLLQKIAELQREDGAWPWFPGGPANEFITLYITTGFGRLRHLGVDISVEPAVKSLQRLDEWIDKQYRDRPPETQGREQSVDHHRFVPVRTQLLPGRPEDRRRAARGRGLLPGPGPQVLAATGQPPEPRTSGHRAEAVRRRPDARRHHAVDQGAFGDRRGDGHVLAGTGNVLVVVPRPDRNPGGDDRSVRRSDERCPGGRGLQSLAAEAEADAGLEDHQGHGRRGLRLLLRGTDLLASTELVQITLGGTVIEPQNVEAGTGFYEQRFAAGEIKPQMGRVTVKKIDEGVAWGSLHWQYLEDMAKITPHEANPLIVRKRLYVKEYTDKGPVLKAVEGPVKVGDELVVRVGIRVDRDMEYVHLRDHRGSGTEPVNVLSQYKYQDGLAYYESTRDTASHFFIDYLPKGTYVFEYSTRVVHRGEYQTGMAQVQCMYAPEFNSHSESIPLKVE
jgi:hypothetical protein